MRRNKFLCLAHLQFGRLCSRSFRKRNFSRTRWRDFVLDSAYQVNFKWACRSSSGRNARVKQADGFQFTKMFGLQEVDALIQEMLLSRDDTDPIFRLNSPTSTAPPRQEIIDLPPTAPQQHQPDSQGQRHSFLVMSETMSLRCFCFFNRLVI